MHWTTEQFVERADAYVVDLERKADEAPDDVADLLSTLGYEDDVPDRALDVGCGIGRHVLAFARHGTQADGVDLSPTFVERARDLAVDAGLDDHTRFVVGDMRDLGSLGLTDEYDLVTSLYSTFGYFDDETNEAVLRTMADRLAPGGTLVVDTRNKEQVVCQPDESVTRAGDLLSVETRTYDSLTSRVRGRIRIIDDPVETVRSVFEFDVRVYTPVELVALFERVGLTDVAAWGSLAGEPVTRQTPRLVVRGRRPAESLTRRD